MSTVPHRVLATNRPPGVVLTDHEFSVPLDHDVTVGHLCIKGRFGFEFAQARAPEPER